MTHDKTRLPTTPPVSPPCHQDRLFQDLSKYSRSKHASQLLPKANEFTLGQGDPLLTAAIEHSKLLASNGSHRQLAIDQLEIEDKGSTRRHSRVKQKSLPDMSTLQTREDEIHEPDHLIEHGSPFAGLGMNDVVHLANGTVVSVPCVSPKVVKQIVSSHNDGKRGHNQRRHSMPNLFHRHKHQDHTDKDVKHHRDRPHWSPFLPHPNMPSGFPIAI